MISIRNLWKRYGNTQVLQGLNLEVAQGEILVILGRSGVGKSVLLRHIMGIEKPDRGEIFINDIEVTSDHPHLIKNMGMLFQGSALFDSMTIGENAAFYLQQHGDPRTGKPIPSSCIREKVSQALTMVGLAGKEEEMPANLSGGMRKRAALARLIVYRPSILLYDEPTTGLDPITAKQINELILTTQKELRGTSIIVTHDMLSAFYLADRLALHQDGKIAHLADPKTFLKIDDPTIQMLKESLKLYTENDRPH
ncbi:MAG: ATP-binding cassette domain-containing protein [Verrucomicrobiota bacterium]|nr:ATP-binding cassette domain-containing protein [Verrucomicrobiota bacterium]